METLRTETAQGVREIVLARPEAYNTITPALRDELAAAIDAADADREVGVILLRAEGPAFCAGYGLDWSTPAQAAARRLEEWREKAAADGVEAEARLSANLPSMGITDAATEEKADLIVMGTRGLSGIKHVLLGSVAERTLRTAPCPVLTVKHSKG